MSTEENKALVRRYLDELDRGNFAGLDQVLSPNYLYHIPGNPVPLNREQHKQFVAMFYTAAPDLRHRVEEQVAEGDRVATRSTNRGTHRGELMGIPQLANRS